MPGNSRPSKMTESAPAKSLLSKPSCHPRRPLPSSGTNWRMRTSTRSPRYVISIPVVQTKRKLAARALRAATACATLTSCAAIAKRKGTCKESVIRDAVTELRWSTLTEKNMSSASTTSRKTKKSRVKKPNRSTKPI